MESIVEKGNDDSSNTTKVLVENIFKFLTTFINAFFNLLNSPTGIMWGILILLTLQVKMAKATPISSSDVNSQSTMMDSLGHNAAFILYPMKPMEASSFITQLKEEEFYESHTMETESLTFLMNLKNTRMKFNQQKPFLEARTSAFMYKLYVLI